MLWFTTRHWKIELNSIFSDVLAIRRARFPPPIHHDTCWCQNQNIPFCFVLDEKGYKLIKDQSTCPVVSCPILLYHVFHVRAFNFSYQKSLDLDCGQVVRCFEVLDLSVCQSSGIWRMNNSLCYLFDRKTNKALCILAAKRERALLLAEVPVHLVLCGYC